MIYPGKPHAPIYELAMKRATELLGRPVKKSEVLAIGDGLKTDSLGAQRFGVASLFVAEGIHVGDLTRDGSLDQAEVDRACAAAGVTPVAVIPSLAP